MDDEKCYVYKADNERPAKRRRVSPDVDALWPARQQIYQQLWHKQHERLQNVIDDASRATYDEILAFLSDDGDAHEARALRNIKAGYVLAGPDTTSHAALFAELEERICSEQEDKAMVTIRASDAPNLKTLLKVLIRKVLDISHVSEIESGKFLDYDLGAVHLWLQDKQRGSLVLGIVDSEAFQASVLADLLGLLRSWQDRIPVTILFGIATSIEIFQDRLPRAALLSIDATQFDVVQSDELLESLFEATMSADDDEITVRMGPQLCLTILQRQRQNIQSSQDFVNALQYAYMCHFYANRLAVLLGNGVAPSTIDTAMFSAIRCLPSFQSETDRMIETGELDAAEALLDSNTTLFAFAQRKILESLGTLRHVNNSVRLLQAVQAALAGTSSGQTFSSLYIATLRDDMRDSAVLRECLLKVKKAPSDVLTRILSDITPWIADECQKTLDPLRLGLKRLLQSIGDEADALKSRHDTKNETMRTTVVAHKVELSRHKANITEKDAAYSKIVESVHDWLADYLVQTLKPVSEIPLHEVLIYDGRGPDRSVFMPRHRYVIERALSSPHDYLNCECCESTAADGINESALAKTQPYTALLYQLYTESGALINAADLWTAFNGILSEDGDEDESKNMYLFQRALAELQYLGLVRGTKRKTDHLVKVSWKGL